MTEQTTTNETRPTVKLTGADGNAYNIIGLCKKSMKTAGWPLDKIDAVTTEMMSGDYDHLLGTVMTYFDVE